MQIKSKKLSVVLTVILTLAIIFTAGASLIANAAYAHEYYYASGTKFIKNIAICYYKDSNEGKNAIRNCCEVLVEKDLTAGTGGDYYVYMGYNTTTNPNEAITGIRVYHAGGTPYPVTSNMNGSNVSFYPINSGVHDWVPKLHGDGCVDLNKGAGGDDLTLYITKDHNAGAPITALTADNTQVHGGTGWFDVTTTQDTSYIIDVNKGAGGQDIFIHYYTPCSSVSTTTLRSTFNSSAAYTSSANYTIASKNTLNSARNNASAVISALDNNSGCSTYTQSTINSYASAMTSAVSNLKTTVYLDAASRGGSCSTSSFEATIGTSSTVTLNMSSYVATKAGWDFLGWTTDVNGRTGSKTSVTVGFNQTLYAVFSKTITANLHYLDASGTEQTIVKTATIYNNSSAGAAVNPLPADTTFDGRAFTALGWRDDTTPATAEYTTTNLSLPATNSTYNFYAVYSGALTFTQDANKGTGAPAAQTVTQYLNTYNGGTRTSASFTVTSAVPSREGCTFLGWSDITDTETASYTAGHVFSNVISDKTIYATWTATKYQVRFFDEDGTQIGATQSIKHGEDAVAPAAPVKAPDDTNHYTFNGWTGYTEIKSDKDITATYTATAHDLITTVDVAPTCTETGISFNECAVCGHSFTAVIPALGHTPATIYGRAATCTEDGISDGQFCSVCDVILVPQTVIPALGHDYVGTVTPATCKAEGYTTYVCSKNHAHTYVADYTPITGHTPVIDAAVPATCTVNGLTEGSHCSVCGATLVSQRTTLANGHKIVTDAAVAPTCTADGLTQGSHCSVCGEIFTAQTVITATGHTSVVDAEVPADCTNDGHTAGTHCSVCGEILSGNEVIPALGHSFADAVVVPSTCTVAGTSTATCTVCGESVVTTLELAPHTPATVAGYAATCTAYGMTDGSVCSVCGTTLEAQKTIRALGHTYGAWTVVTPATCTLTGTSTRECSVCLATEERTDAALGHKLGNWIVTTQPTCTDAGEKTRYCSACDYTETLTVDALGHKTVTDAAVAPTCTEVGYTEGSHCSRCDLVFTAQTEIPALGHDLGEEYTVASTCTVAGEIRRDCSRCDYYEATALDLIAHTPVTDVAVAATCTATGLTEGSHCSVCNIVLTAQEKTAKLAHTPEVVAGYAPTCTADGLTDGSVCSVCGTVLTAQTVIKATGHSFGAWEIAKLASCTEDGLRVRTCTVCGETETRALPALGHNVGAFNTVTAPTCTENGLAKAVCSRCDYYETKVLNALGHTVVADAAVAPTCTQVGFTEGSHCSVCKYVFVAQIIIPATGHSYAVDTVVPATCTEQGYTTYVCTVCGDTYDGSYVNALGHSGGTATCTVLAVCAVCGESYGELASHNYIGVVTAPTCTAVGFTTYTCAVCGDTKIADYTDMIAHTWDNGVVASAPSCTDAGNKVYTCSVCGAKKNEEIASLGHSVTEWTLKDGMAYGTCSRCGQDVCVSAEEAGLVNEVCPKCGKVHTDATGFFSYDGIYCKLISFFRNIANLFKGLFG